MKSSGKAARFNGAAVRAITAGGKSMTAKELLGVLIRAAGLGFIGCGVVDVVHLLARAIGAPTTQQYPSAMLATAVVFWFLLGVAIIASADLVVRLVYRRGS